MAADNKPSTTNLSTGDKDNKPIEQPYNKDASPIPRQGNVGITSLPGTDYPKDAKPIKASNDNAPKAGDSKMFFTE